jgi:hypothetical protein
MFIPYGGVTVKGTIIKAARDFLELTLAEKTLFVKLAFKDISRNEWEALAEQASRAWTQKYDRGRFAIPAVEKYMEKRLRGDMQLTPRRLARECVHYKKLPPAMMGYAVRAAQRVKKRLWMQRHRREKARAAGAAQCAEKLDSTGHGCF